MQQDKFPSANLRKIELSTNNKTLWTERLLKESFFLFIAHQVLSKIFTELLENVDGKVRISNLLLLLNGKKKLLAAKFNVFVINTDSEKFHKHNRCVFL